MSLRRARPLLGTLVDIRVDGLDDVAAGAALDAAFAEIAQVQRAMSFHSQYSDLARLHAARVGQAVRVDPRTAEVLRAALAVAALSDGAFDPCVAMIAVARGALPRPASSFVPEHGATWRDIELPGDHEVRLRRPLWIDLGGIAKGYAVDRAIDMLRARGVRQACVNAGGDLRVFGPVAESVALRIGSDSPAQLIDLADGAVASSARASALRQGAASAQGAEPNLSSVIGSSVTDLIGSGFIESGFIGSGLAGSRVPGSRVIGASVVASTCMHADALTKVVLLAPAAIVDAALSAYGAQAFLHRGAVQHRDAGLAA